MLDILIADDHSIVRHGLELLTYKAVGETCRIDFAESGEEVLKQLKQKKYTILMSDLMMPDRKGIALIGQALDLQPELRIIIISVGSELDFAAQCLQHGAYAFVNKGVSDFALSKAIRSVAYESEDYHAHMRKTTTQAPTLKDKDRRSLHLLSQREQEVVSLLLQGQGIVEIARALSISTSAASTLKGRAFTKLNVQSVVELSRLAYYQGLHPDGGAILS